MNENFQQNDDSIGPDSVSPEQIIEAIEACRPGSNDASDPSLAFIADHADFIDLRSHIEQTDAKIKKAFADVPVPAGLESRILAALAEAPAADETNAEESVPADETIPLAVPAKPRRRYRHWYLGASAVFVAASLMVALVLQWTAAPPMSESFVVQKAMDNFDAPLAASPLPKELPQAVKDFAPSRALQLSKCTSFHWQAVNNFLDKKGVVYSFITPQGAEARLYVLDAPGRILGLPSSPPNNPPGNTLGLRAATWQSGSRLYVLVVRGDIHTYRRLLVPPGPLT